MFKQLPCKDWTAQRLLATSQKVGHCECRAELYLDMHTERNVISRGEDIVFLHRDVVVKLTWRFVVEPVRGAGDVVAVCFSTRFYNENHKMSYKGMRGV